MPWRFEQKTGRVLFGDVFTHRAYSGHGPGVNNPLMQDIVGVGPIPVGRYRIGGPKESIHTGRFILTLTPEPGTETFNRHDFEWHGDSVEHPGLFLASHGCIISPRHERETVVESGDTLLEVVSGLL